MKLQLAEIHQNLKLFLLALFVPFALAACSNKGSEEQQKAFQEAVSYEATTESAPARQREYMKVVAMDPGSETGKAARERVDQLGRVLEAVLGPQ